MNPPVRPRVLHPGDTIGLCAPSGFITKTLALEQATHYLNGRGYELVISPHIHDRWEYFSGPDDSRATDLLELSQHKQVRMIMMARGGYGLTRLLHQLDFEALAESRKIFVGFSDVTALHLALLARASYVSFAGPMACPDFGHDAPSDWHPDHFEGMLQSSTHQSPPIPLGMGDHVPALRSVARQGIEGVLWGGNLSLVTHLAGTPYMPSVPGGLLFLEEVNEEPYHVERMLMQLFHAGLLQDQQAILLGSFLGCEPTARSASPYPMSRVVEYLRQRTRLPVFEHLPFGHVREKITLPVGGLGRIELMDEAHYRITFSEYNAP